MIVTDNEIDFTIAKFEECLKSNGICQTQTAPYHPALNGIAKQAVQTFKSGMKKLTSGIYLRSSSSQISLQLPNNPQTTTGVSPSELLFGCHLRCHLDLLHPNTEAKVCQNQYQQRVTWFFMPESKY